MPVPWVPPRPRSLRLAATWAGLAQAFGLEGQSHAVSTRGTHPAFEHRHGRSSLPPRLRPPGTASGSGNGRLDHLFRFMGGHAHGAEQSSLCRIGRDGVGNGVLVLNGQAGSVSVVGRSKAGVHWTAPPGLGASGTGTGGSLVPRSRPGYSWRTPLGFGANNDRALDMLLKENRAGVRNTRRPSVGYGSWLCRALVGTACGCV